MKMTKERQEELQERNKRIIARYCEIAEKQPLATHYAIAFELTKEFNLSPQMIALIVTEAGVSVSKTIQQ